MRIKSGILILLNRLNIMGIILSQAIEDNRDQIKKVVKLIATY